MAEVEPRSSRQQAALLGVPLALCLIFFFCAPSPIILLLREFETGEALRDVVRDSAGILALFEILVLVLALRLLFNRMKRIAVVDSLKTVEAQTARKGLEAALQASTAKSQFLASLSHEIRAPLNAIYGYAQLVERGDATSVSEAARIIARSAEHLTSLVDGLLDIAQVEHGILRVHSDTVRLPMFLDHIVSMFRHMASAKGLAVVLELPEQLPEFVRVDEKRLRQILINLLSNAVKFTDKGTVRLRVDYSSQMTRFEVIDTGIGIAPEDRERIFTPFSAERGERQGGSSVGLGLPITQALVQILGGELELESEVGQGTTFRVLLRLSQGFGELQKTAPMTRITGYAGRRRTILAVDDDMQQLALVTRVLELKGFDVLTATSGEMALTLSGNMPIDLALLDISMPGLSGWETAAALRRRAGDTIRIVMLSGNAAEVDERRNQPGLHDLFLTKPIDIQLLIDCIGRELRLEWETDPLNGPANALPAPVSSASSLPEAARPHLRRLRELLRIGHVRGIEAEIRRISEAAPEAEALTSGMFGKLDRFDLVGLAREVDALDGQQERTHG